MTIKSKQFVLLKRPVGLPEESVCRLEDVNISSDLKEGELHLRGLYYSVDPYMRGRMNDAKSYVAPFVLNEPINGSVVARVVESRASAFVTGDLVFGQLPWATEMVVPCSQVQKLAKNSTKPSDYLGVLGMTGLTAYFGLLTIGQPKKGETVVISGAAGAVGNVVGQIAKIKGCKVIGIVGSIEKEKILKDRFHFDETINYKTSEDLANLVKKACPNGVDIYFDNVGGEVSDSVIQNINVKGRIVLCGQISLYNVKEIPVGPRLQPLLLTRSASMQGFIVSNFKEKFSEGIVTLSSWLSEGKLQSFETVVNGFENLPKAFIGLFSGKNIGKMIVKAD